MLARLFSRFRKHSFDLDNPTIIKTGIVPLGENTKLILTKFRCTQCGKTLLLDRWQMKDLPRSMSHGCYPSSNQSLS